jgi:hypothetical protein
VGNAILTRSRVFCRHSLCRVTLSFVNGRHPFVGYAISKRISLRRHSRCRVTLSFVNDRHPFVGLSL